MKWPFYVTLQNEMDFTYVINTLHNLAGPRPAGPPEGRRRLVFACFSNLNAGRNHWLPPLTVAVVLACWSGRPQQHCLTMQARLMRQPPQFCTAPTTKRAPLFYLADHLPSSRGRLLHFHPTCTGFGGGGISGFHQRRILVDAQAGADRSQNQNQS